MVKLLWFEKRFMYSKNINILRNYDTNFSYVMKRSISFGTKLHNLFWIKTLMRIGNQKVTVNNKIRAAQKKIYAWSCQVKHPWVTLSLRKKSPYSELFWSAFSCIQWECRKMRTRVSPNTGSVHAVYYYFKNLNIK